MRQEHRHAEQFNPLKPQIAAEGISRKYRNQNRHYSYGHSNKHTVLEECQKGRVIQNIIEMHKGRRIRPQAGRNRTNLFRRLDRGDEHP
ncbi:hypothetical protein D3C76_1681080 [compost metagenome]